MLYMAVCYMLYMALSPPIYQF